MKNTRLIDFTVEELEILLYAILDKKRPIEPPRFVAEEEARKQLNCGKTHLYHLRISGKIGYVQDPDHPKLILYDRLSIEKYLEENLKKAF